MECLDLVTTNFDRLFHEASQALEQEFREHSAPTLPRATNEKWNGLVFLHGVLPQNDKNDEDKEALNRLVITSGDFGLVYLWEGWAIPFIRDLFRNYHVCFVGYSLSDPIMRYIVDALAADQGSDSSKKPWIFTDYKDEKDKEEKKYQWDGRGVTPILYDSSKDHDYLHQTLQDWGEFYEKGLEGKKELIQKHCHKKPEEIEKHLKGQILWALMDKSGEVFKVFSELVQPPPFEWGEEFRKDPEIKQYLHLLFGRKGWSNIFIGAGRVEEDKIVEHISYYFVRHVENIKLFHMILEAEKFGGFLLYGIESKLLDQLYALEQDDSSAKKKEELNRLIFSGSSRASSLDENMAKIKELADALEKPKETKDQQMLTLWRLYFLGKIYKENMDLEGCLKVGRWYERFKEGNGILTSLLREELYSLLEPKVKVSLNEEGTIIQCSIILYSHNKWNIYDNRIPLDFFEKLLEDVLKLYYLLKERGFDVESSFKTVSSIEDYNKNICDIHKEYGLFASPSIHNAWGMCIVLLRYSWGALYQHNKEEAGRVAQKWWGKPDIIFKRLALFAASQGAIESSLWGEWILENDAAYLWAKEGAYIEYRREIMRLLTHQGKNLSGEIQETLEKMILDGKEENEIWFRLKKIRILWFRAR